MEYVSNGSLLELNKLDLNDPKNFREYAVNIHQDDLLYALYQCKKSPEKRNAIIQILTIQQELSGVLEKNHWDDLDLKILIDMFYANPNPSSYRHVLMENGDKNPELSFKYFLLKCFTLLNKGSDLSDEEKDIFAEFKIDISSPLLILKLKSELEQDLKVVFCVDSGKFIDIWDKGWFSRTIDIIGDCSGEMLLKKIAHGRLDGKKFMPWHCAYDDSPDWLKFFGEDVVIYEIWDDFIPCSNCGHKLSLIDKVNSCNVDELEKMYLSMYKNDLKHMKLIYYDNESYINFLRNCILLKNADLLSMYDSGDRFLVVKWTYFVTEIQDFKTYKRWCVDIRSQKTWEIYRVLSD